ncbi:type IX secretion system protein PorQ [Larkinella humicola]|uniref:Type IX secretion system protein PorQ n=1 Tax=Larkinella humicola TaxID=2607654 RepID=A0A5N1JTC1_9BACT|nr:type IX secretion system protein PorQ [Larkinella humicola]KAA9357033.1 type IX secretion system protein PorQ [Larkinella humicola]
MKSLLLIFFFLIPSIIVAQPPGGQAGFAFLNVPTHARVAALGGLAASNTQPGVLFLLQNPALLDSSGRNQLAMTFVPYFADTRFITLQYGLPIKTTGQWAAGLQYLTYGTFDQSDLLGNPTGTFTSSDYALSLTHARTEGNFTLGATLKAVGSSIETYSAFAVLFDVGGTWRHPKKELIFGVVAKNAGFRLKNYFPGQSPDLPFDLQAGVTVKPEHLPIRATLTAHHLHQFDIVYNDPALNVTYDLNGNPVQQKTALPEKILRHLAVGLEFLIHRNVNLLAGYSHMRRQEAKLATGSGAAGLSFGIAVQAKGFQLTYARALATPTVGGSSHLSFSINLNRIMAKK